MPNNRQHDYRKKFMEFVGYGPNAPKVVFFGLEEAAPDPRKGPDDARALRDNLRVRFEQFPDVRFCKNETHRVYLGEDYLEPGAVPVWNMASRIMAYWRKTGDWQAEYRRLGTSHGDSLLAELRPIPRCAVGYWDDIYTDVFGWRTNGEYRREMWEGRREMLRTKIFAGESSPNLAFSYGAEANRVALQFAPPVPSQLNGKEDTVHELETVTTNVRGKQVTIPRLRVCLDSQGVRWGHTGFYGGRTPGKMTIDRIPALVDAMISLKPVEAL